MGNMYKRGIWLLVEQSLEDIQPYCTYKHILLSCVTLYRQGEIN